MNDHTNTPITLPTFLSVHSLHGVQEDHGPNLQLIGMGVCADLVLLVRLTTEKTLQYLLLSSSANMARLYAVQTKL